MEEMTNLMKSLENRELVMLYGTWYEEMKSRGIIRTRNIVGEVGEYFAVETYRDNPRLPDLSPAHIGMKHYDAMSQDGTRYTVKTVTGTSTGVFYGLHQPGSLEEDERLFDYLIIVVLAKDYGLSGVYEMDWETFMELKSWHSRMSAWKIGVNNKVLSRCVRVDDLE